MPQPRIEVVSGPSGPDCEQQVRATVRNYNRAHSRIAEGLPLMVIALDEEGEFAGGIAGETWGSVFELVYFGVREDWRRQGLGAGLLARAEEEAIARGCVRVVLDTYSFQAPDYYPAHGYREIARVEGFGDGAAKHFFVKELKG